MASELLESTEPSQASPGVKASPGVIGAYRTSDGYTLYYRTWPTAQPKARLIILHGIRSHGGWYYRSCELLARAGYEVHFLDRRGAGLHTAKRGDAPGFRRLLDDVIEFATEQRRKNAWLPTVVVGISWGGKLAAALPYRKPWLVDGVALLCPGLKPLIQPPLAQRLRIALARMLRPSKYFPIPLNEPELFTDSPSAQQFIDEDRFGLKLATARFLFASFGLDVYLRRAVKGLTVPTLLMLAGRDKIINNAKTREFMLGAGREVQVIDYPEAAHTLEFEADGHPYLNDLCQWIDNRLLSRSACSDQ